MPFMPGYNVFALSLKLCKSLLQYAAREARSSVKTEETKRAPAEPCCGFQSCDFGYN
jgi:hypothetical protein